MSYVNPQTGEILEGKEVLDLEDHPELDRWGDVVRDALEKVVVGPWYRKKRATLLKLAEHAFENMPQYPIWHMEHTGSRQAHWKWMNNDADYAAAFAILVGTVSDPGTARLQRAEIIDEAEDLAVTALADARAQLRVASSQAVQTLVDGLTASNRYGPKWHERIMAANSILDRADPETAAHQAPQQAIIDKAIMHVYGVSPKTLPDPKYNFDDQRTASATSTDALPSGKHEPEHEHDMVLDGDYINTADTTTVDDDDDNAAPSPGAGPQHDSHSDAIKDLVRVIDQSGKQDNG